MLRGVGVSLQLLHLFLQGGFLSCASSQLSSQLALLLPQQDVVLAQPVEVQLQLLQSNRSLSIIIIIAGFHSSQHDNSDVPIKHP